jgi:tetratricopeptide (TPR) repeat protein
MTRLAALGLLVLSLSITGRALGDDKQTAREAFKEGVTAFQAGDYKAALERFERADHAAHSPAITYNIARTLEKLERPQRAVDAYEAYIAEAGEAGEFTAAATVAIAQIKGRSSRLRIESTPPGASVTIDGEKVGQKTPLALLVARGQHEVVIELDDWREQRVFQATGAGSSGEILFVRGQAPPPPPPPPAAPVAKPPEEKPKPEIDGLVGSAGLSLSAYRFVGSAEERSGAENTTADNTPGGLIFGLAFDAGYALSRRSALLLRGFGGLGSSESSLASLGAAGPVFSYRVSDRWWVGGGLAVGAGRADADATTRNTTLVDAKDDSQITFETDFALGPTLELGYVLDQNEDGHWLVSLMPTTLFTTGGEESTLFFAFMLGYRWF